MKIDFKKVNVSNHEMEIVRSDYSSEKTILDTKTYLLHDICHFFVEKELNTLDGFWGMLSRGYQLGQLFGKTNHLTEKLRIIESIVGGPSRFIQITWMNQSFGITSRQLISVQVTLNFSKG
jgi:hypothetical protein